MNHTLPWWEGEAQLPTQHNLTPKLSSTTARRKAAPPARITPACTAGTSLLMRITGGLKEHLGGTDHRLRLGISRVKSFRPEKQVSSPTSDVQLLLHALDVGGRFLLDEVEDLDGIGHPEEDVLQVREKVGDGEAGQGGRVLAGETLGVLQLLLLSIPLKLLGRKEPAWGNARKAFAPRLPPPPKPSTLLG